MQPQPIKITVGDREQSSGIPQILAAMDNVTALIQRLPLGDYDLDGRLLVERKTLPDFAGAVIDGRLFRHLQSLPGVGPTRAARLLDHFGSVQAVLNARVDSIACVQGIGPTIAKGIQQIVRELQAIYGLGDDLMMDL